MPKYKNRFVSPEFMERKIVTEEGNEVVGTIRVKPVSISWKPKGRAEYLTVRLEDFVAWITDPATRAKKRKS